MISPRETYSPAALSLREKLEALRTQLIDLAYAMDRRGHAEAADVAMMTSRQIGELCEDQPERSSVRDSA